jgi:hypothetical protein
MSNVEEFLHDIFDLELLIPGEEICFNCPKGQHLGYPSDYTSFQRHARGKNPRGMYFNTATMGRTDDGVLYARDKLFRGLWCVVLDDIGDGIGAKCERTDLPEGLWEGASWRIESSPGNYQLGYILDAPIRELTHAKAIIRLIYGAGPWDSGGALASKWVRLPLGNNMKDKYATDGKLFAVNMPHYDPITYTPDELLSLVGAGVGWADIQAGLGDKRDPRRTRGTTAYRASEAHLDLDGVVDVLAEWLHDNDMVVNVRHPWLDVVCPWAEDHTTDSKSSTSYSPLGWGEDPYEQSRRGFSCLHGHCDGNKTREFIDWCMGMGAPPVPIAGLVSRWVFDASRCSWVDVMSPSLHRVADRGFRTANQEKVYFPKGPEEWGYAPIYNLLVTNPSLVKTYGPSYEPGGDLISGEGYSRRINDCRIPFYGDGPYNQADIDQFLGFLHYLMPNEEDADWFVRHMAMKVQHPQYRGPGVFMHTATQGTGRGTLGRMLEKLWGHHLVHETGMKAFMQGIGGGSSVFNARLQALWIVVPEAKDGTLESGKVAAQSYETLKRFIEPSPVAFHYNMKGVEGWDGFNYASVLICSNHFDGLRLDLTDRRVKRIHNTTQPESAGYFNSLYQWLSGDWATSVWRFLSQYDCGDYTGTEPQDAEQSEADQEERLLSQSGVDLGVSLAIEWTLQHCTGVHRTQDLLAGIESCAVELELHGLRGDYRAVVRREILRSSSAIAHEGVPQVYRVSGELVKLRVITKGRGSDLLIDVRDDVIAPRDVVECYSGMDTAAMGAYIKKRLSDLGRF